MKKIRLLFFFIAIATLSQDDNIPKITLQDIWVYYKFYPHGHGSSYVLKDGEHYVEVQDSGSFSGLVKHPITAKRKPELILKKSELSYKGEEIDMKSEFFFSPDENYILFKRKPVPIYRRSVKNEVFVYSFPKKKLIKIPGEANIMFPKFSPDSKKLAYVKDNNLFYYDLENEKEIQITFDGKNNEIKNGWGDWVYEEEFSRPDYFEWSESSNRLAYIRFDESRVKEFTIYFYHDSLYPQPYTFKYPKAGEDNSMVSFHVYDLITARTFTPDIGIEKDIYLPRLFAAAQPDVFCLLRLNRRQNKLEYLFYDANMKAKQMLVDSSDTYVDVYDDVFIKKDGLYFLSERTNFQHIHYLDFKTGKIRPVTKGNFDVMKVYGMDDKKGLIFYQSTENGAHRRDVYCIKTDGTGKKRLSLENGFNDAEFYAGMKYYVLSHSDANTPPVYELYTSDGKKIKTFEDNAELRDKLKKYNLSKKEFFTVKNRSGQELNAWMLKPAHFDPNKKYPVYMYAYNGPGSNEVNDSWESMEIMWHQLLCQEGFIVFCMDGRGTMGRGRAFKHSTYLQLGGPESDDQIDAAKYLATLPYVDAKKIVFQGWSYGGFMATLMITKGAEHVAGAVAVAPVTNWKFYDNIYTERYMRKPSENPDGYEKNTPMFYAKKYKGKLLLIHGDADDNVHVQNSHELAKVLIKYGKPFDYFIYPNKNHGIFGGMTRYHVYDKILNFVKQIRDDKN
jgi:dipeptidyl-peptidase-4